MNIEVYNRNDLASVLNELSDFENLRFETDRLGGFLLAEFECRRDILNAQDDLAVYNPIIISEGPSVAWEGYIIEPRKVSPAAYNVSCLGWPGLLNDTGTSDNQGSQKMSTFITGTMLADPAVSAFISAGTILTSDYTCPAFTDVSPWKYHIELLDEYNKWNDLRWYISEGRKFNLGATQTAGKWIVLAEDAPGFEISDSPANFWNKVIYQWDDGGGVAVATVSDAPSIATYGRTVCKSLDIPGTPTDAQALAIANVYLTRGKTMTVMGSIKTQTVYDAVTHNPVDVWKVRGGDVVKLQNFLAPSAYTGNMVDELTTFEIKATQYEHPTKTITLVPKDWDSGLEPLFTKLEAKSKR